VPSRTCSTATPSTRWRRGWGMPGGRLRCGDRPRHRFFHSCIPVAEFGSSWPDGVPVQVHGLRPPHRAGARLPPRTV